ncbi:hypothetical protein [Micromonospora sp. CPCC 206061]|uniref:hypothetical protein n=1 Tax=Micromonospora sp. CPCC 206061 TaxID=3122410 RepID=UPI002FF2FF33
MRTPYPYPPRVCNPRAGDIAGLAAAVDRVVLEIPAAERRELELRARSRAMGFDRGAVFDSLFPSTRAAAVVG